MVTPIDPSQARRDWQAALQPTPDCLAADRLTGDLTPHEIQHVAGCARCQAERNLWEEFQESRPGEDEATVRDIAAELRRRRHLKTSTLAFPTPSVAQPRRLAVPAWLQIAAGLAVTTALGYGLWDRQPVLRDPGPAAPVYRSLSIETAAPDGDLAAAPRAFEWTPTDGVVRYDLKVREVDGTEFWSGSSAEPLLLVPPDVQLRIQPGKTLLWEVIGITARGDIAARSTPRRFRVVVRPS
jgi:hypothetical protein